MEGGAFRQRRGYGLLRHNPPDEEDENRCGDAREGWTRRGSRSRRRSRWLTAAAAGASVPSGASTGRSRRTSCAMRPHRYGGLGGRNAVGHIQGEMRTGAHRLDGHEQRALDATMCELDGTPTLARLGANATLAGSLRRAGRCAVARADLFERVGELAALRQLTCRW